MSKLTKEIKFQARYYYRNIKGAVTWYVRNLAHALAGKNILDEVNGELREALQAIVAENYRLVSELKKPAKTKKTVKKKEK